MSSSVDETAIRHIIDEWVEAFREKSVARIVATHAADIVSFDILPPLRYIGIENYLEPWHDTFAAFDGPIAQEIHDLDIAVGGDVAFSHSLNRMTGTYHDGRTADFWFRSTTCYRKIDGRWLVVHHHTSAPTDFETGSAVLDLVP
ncbi:YybH family protein [Nocardia asiatica]|uniref:YybH family protein n=1 Tax=Nocardia asiatica TaxID=209252 RepID=UPI002457EA1F|nr:nuclear transport factor 2 family protein [Nocardia asiatica]